MSKRQTYPREFKLEAVRLLDRGEKPAAQLARELGVARNRLRWLMGSELDIVLL